MFGAFGLGGSLFLGVCALAPAALRILALSTGGSVITGSGPAHFQRDQPRRGSDSA